MIKIDIQFFGGRGGAGGKGGGGGSNKSAAARQAIEGKTYSERAIGLVQVMTGSGWSAKESTVSKAVDYGGDYMTEVRIDTSRKGYFKTTFTYSDGVSRKEVYDSVAAVTQAADSFFKRQRNR